MYCIMNKKSNIEPRKLMVSAINNQPYTLFSYKVKGKFYKMIYYDKKIKCLNSKGREIAIFPKVACGEKPSSEFVRHYDKVREKYFFKIYETIKALYSIRNVDLQYYCRDIVDTLDMTFDILSY